MKKEFEPPLIEIIYFDQNIKLLDDSGQLNDPDLDNKGWI